MYSANRIEKNNIKYRYVSIEHIIFIFFFFLQIQEFILLEQKYF